MSSFFDPGSEIERWSHKLPHWKQSETWVFLTWRLADSLPKAKIDLWDQQRKIWLGHHPKPWDEATEEAYHERFSHEVDKWLDAGSGSCLLRKQENARIVAEALHYFDGSRYRLDSYVVMPNHVHVLFSPDAAHPPGNVVHSWKRHSARLINTREGSSGSLWQPDYWDRLIRSQRHFDWVRAYIAKNPEKLPKGQFLLWEKE